MSEKSLKDEKQELQKQIGCIAGFFQLFDRHRFLTTSSHINQTPSSGGSNDDIKELNSTMQKTKAKNVKIARKKQQLPTEPSITSVSSSSCSSSISSIELNRTTKTESPSTSQIRISQNQHSQEAMKQHDLPNKQSVDLHDIVKDSMHREAQGLSVKTVATKQEKKGQTYALKRIDSPRPLQPHKSVNAGVMVDSEPIHIISKSKRTPWDSPRLSYDGRYTQDTWKSTSKLKELPRLSLDSKERSIRGVNEGNKSRNLLNGTQKLYRKNSCTTLNQLQEPETSRRSSSVVAKLMGLEALPDLAQPFETPHETSSCSSNKEVFMEKSNTSSDIKSKGSDSDIKSSKSSSLSVYGEIEKRLAELEFKKSGKDLRALKQILEAMQRHQDSPSDNKSNASLCETSREQSPRIPQKDSVSVTVEISNSPKGSILPIVVMKPTRATRKANNPSSATKAKGISSTTKSNKDSFGQPVSSSDKNNNLRTSKMMQSSKVPQDRNGKNSTNPCNMTVTGSPRLQKKFGFERPSPPTSPSSYSSINRRQQNRQHVELSSSSTTCRQNFSNLQDRNERFNEVSHHWRNSKHHVNVISSDFDSNRSLATHGDIEVIQIDQSGNIKSSSIQLRRLNQNGTFEELRKERPKAEKIIISEQPSPVSVLDDAFYTEDPPSPVKKKSNISKNFGEALSTDDDSEENSVDLPHLSCTTNANLSNGSSDRDMNTQNLAQILQEIDWLDEKLLNLNNSNNPDHKYISEILLASGVLSGRSSSEILHSTGHVINPKLFFALEQIKTMKRNSNIEDRPVEQMQRKLIFDVVNDILVQKLIFESSSTLWCIPNELAGRKLKGQQLLEELCTEIDQLQPQKRNVSFVHEDENFTSLLSSDLKHNHTIWTNCSSEMPNVALDIERLIFKDLITEVVRDELSNNFGSHCRQLLFRK